MHHAQLIYNIGNLTQTLVSSLQTEGFAYRNRGRTYLQLSSFRLCVNISLLSLRHIERISLNIFVNYTVCVFFFITKRGINFTFIKRVYGMQWYITNIAFEHLPLLFRTQKVSCSILGPDSYHTDRGSCVYPHSVQHVAGLVS
jgi:hypothetical protein